MNVWGQKKFVVHVPNFVPTAEGKLQEGKKERGNKKNVVLEMKVSGSQPPEDRPADKKKSLKKPP